MRANVVVGVGFRSGFGRKPQFFGGLSLSVLIRARVVIEATTFDFGHLTVDVRLLAMNRSVRSTDGTHVAAPEYGLA